MRTREQYIQGLRKMRRNIYHDGHKIDRDDEIQQPVLNVMGLTFDAVQDPDLKDLCTAKSHLTGETINRFCHVHQNTEDLHKKQDMTRALCRKVGLCIQRCMGVDAINAVNAVSFEADRLNGGKTEYHKNFLKWLERFQSEDLVGSCAQTDMKGERLKRPAQQTDPDMYVHVVEKKSDGIVVRGCKLHISEASISDEILVVPTRALGPDEKDYAVAFAVPSDHEGVKQVVSIHSQHKRKHFQRGMNIGYSDSYILFEDCFVPWERVFLCGEHEFAGGLVEQFASYHRQSYACKVGVGDVLIGAAQTAAEYNGVAKSSHIRDKIIEMNHLNETLYCGCIACAAEGHREASGTWMVDTLLANVHKQNVTRFPYEIARLAQDIAGGLLVTLPSEKDFKTPETGRWIEKYCRGRAGVPVEHRMRILRLIENLTLGAAAVGYLTESMHGAGSPQAQRVMIAREVNLQEKQAAAKRLCGIPKE